MTTDLPKEPVIDAITAEFAVLETLLGELADSDWPRPTPCPGWDVRAQVAHIIGTESMLAKIDPPAGAGEATPGEHIRNDIGAFNEQWVQGLADATPDAMRARFAEVVAVREQALAALTDAEWSEEGFTPAGRDTHGRFMRIRVFDMWMHEQDIRDAVGRPGHEEGPVVELVLDEMEGALGFVVGKKAGAPAGTSVTFELTGPSGRTRHVAVGERAAVVDALDGPADVTLRMPIGVFTRLAGGRQLDRDLVAEVDVDGDAALAGQILANIGYTI